MTEYKDGLLERVISEHEVVEKMLADPPQVILVHVYGVEREMRMRSGFRT